MNMAMNFKVPQIARNFITTYRTITESTATLLHIVNQSVTAFQHCYNYIISKFITQSVLFLQYICHHSPCSPNRSHHNTVQLFVNKDRLAVLWLILYVVKSSGLNSNKSPTTLHMLHVSITLKMQHT